MRGLTRGFCELTLEARDPEALAGFYKEVFGWEELSRQADRVWLECGERSVYFADPEGNVVEAWDFCEHSEGARDGVDALE